MTLRIVHLTDTHYARPGDDVRFKLVRQVPGGLGPFGPIVKQLRSHVLGRDGARHAEGVLWQRMLAEIRAMSSSADQVIVHTGDLTQAGQIDSLRDAHAELQSVARLHLFLVPGNHDLWPNDFPPCSASRTCLQSRVVRSLGCFPPSYPDVRSIQIAKLTVEFVLLDSTIPDSLLNTVALGALSDEVMGGAVREQISHLAPRKARLRVALVHHPVADLPSTSLWRSIQSKVGMSVAMVMLDSAKVRQDLLQKEISVVLCGHEHQPPRTPGDALLEGGHLLQLQAGCPTLYKHFGNSDTPQFSRYDLYERPNGDVELSWMTCELDPVPQWRLFGRYWHDGQIWHLVPPSGPPSSSNRRSKARPPFP